MKRKLRQKLSSSDDSPNSSAPSTPILTNKSKLTSRTGKKKSTPPKKQPLSKLAASRQNSIILHQDLSFLSDTNIPDKTTENTIQPKRREKNDKLPKNTAKRTTLQPNVISTIVENVSDNENDLAYTQPLFQLTESNTNPNLFSNVRIGIDTNTAFPPTAPPGFVSDQETTDVFTSETFPIFPPQFLAMPSKQQPKQYQQIFSPAHIQSTSISETTRPISYPPSFQLSSNPRNQSGFGVSRQPRNSIVPILSQLQNTPNHSSSSLFSQNTHFSSNQPINPSANASQMYRSNVQLKPSSSKQSPHSSISINSPLVTQTSSSHLPNQLDQLDQPTQTIQKFPIIERGKLSSLRNFQPSNPISTSLLSAPMHTSADSSILLQYRNKNRELVSENTNLVSQLKIARREQVVLKRSYESHLVYVQSINTENLGLKSELISLRKERIKWEKEKARLLQALEIDNNYHHNNSNTELKHSTELSPQKLPDACDTKCDKNHIMDISDGPNHFSLLSSQTTSQYIEDRVSALVRVKQLSNELENTKYALNALQLRFDSSQLAYTDLQSSHNALSAQFQQVNEFYAQKSGQYDLLESKYDEIVSQYNQLQLSNVHFQNQLTQIQQLMKEQENVHNNAIQKYSSLQEMYDELTQTKLSIENNTKILQSTITALEIEKNVIVCRYQNICNEKQTVIESHQQLTEQFNKLQLSRDELISHHSAELAFREDESKSSANDGIQRYHQTIEQMTKENSTLKGKLLRIETQLHQINAKYTQLDLQYQSTLLDLSTSQIQLVNSIENAAGRRQSSVVNSSSNDEDHNNELNTPIVVPPCDLDTTISSSTAFNTTILLDTLDNTFEQTVKKLQAYTATLRDSHTQYTSLQTDYDELMSTHTLLQHEHIIQNDSLKSQLKTLSLTNTHLNSTLTHTKDLYDEILSQFKANLIEKNDLQCGKEELKAQLHDLNQNHTTTLTSFRTQLSSLRSQYEAVLIESSNNQEIITAMEAEIGTLVHTITLYEDKTIPQFQLIANEWNEYCTQLNHDLQTKCELIITLEDEFLTQEEKYSTVLIKCKELITQLSSQVFCQETTLHSHTSIGAQNNDARSSKILRSKRTPQAQSEDIHFYHSDDEVCLDDSPQTSSYISILQPHSTNIIFPTPLLNLSPSTSTKPTYVSNHPTFQPNHGFIDLTEQIDELNHSLDDIFFPSSQQLKYSTPARPKKKSNFPNKINFSPIDIHTPLNGSSQNKDTNPVVELSSFPFSSITPTHRPNTHEFYDDIELPHSSFTTF